MFFIIKFTDPFAVVVPTPLRSQDTSEVSACASVYLLNKKHAFASKLQSEERNYANISKCWPCKWNGYSEPEAIHARPKSCKKVVLKIGELITVYTKRISKRRSRNSLTISNFVQAEYL